MQPKYQLFINNESVDPSTGQWFESQDPFSGEAWALIPRAGKDDVDRAVKAAKDALSGPWGKMSASDRGMLMYKLGALIEQNAAELTEAESRDNGKLRSEVGGQVRYVAKYFYYYGGLADKIQGAVVPMDKPKVFNYIRYEPMGVVATMSRLPRRASAARVRYGMRSSFCRSASGGVVTAPAVCESPEPWPWPGKCLSTGSSPASRRPRA